MSSIVGPPIEWDVCPICDQMFAAGYAQYSLAWCDDCQEHHLARAQEIIGSMPEAARHDHYNLPEPIKPEAAVEAAATARTLAPRTHSTLTLNETIQALINTTGGSR